MHLYRYMATIMVTGQGRASHFGLFQYPTPDALIAVFPMGRACLWTSPALRCGETGRDLDTTIHGANEIIVDA